MPHIQLQARMYNGLGQSRAELEVEFLKRFPRGNPKIITDSDLRAFIGAAEAQAGVTGQYQGVNQLARQEGISYGAASKLAEKIATASIAPPVQVTPSAPPVLTEALPAPPVPTEFRRPSSIMPRQKPRLAGGLALGLLALLFFIQPKKRRIRQ